MPWFPAKTMSDSVKGKSGTGADPVERRGYAETRERVLSCYSLKHLAAKHQGHKHRDWKEYSLFPGGRQWCRSLRKGRCSWHIKASEKDDINFASLFLFPTSQKKIPLTQENSQRKVPTQTDAKSFHKSRTIYIKFGSRNSTVQVIKHIHIHLNQTFFQLL